jgi:hypothetical protein
VVPRLLDDATRVVEVLPRDGGAGGGIGERKAGVAEVGVRLVKAEATARGEGERFVEVAAGEVEDAGVAVEGGAGEETAGKVALVPGEAEAVNRLLDVGGGLKDVASSAACAPRARERSAGRVPSRRRRAARREMTPLRSP